MCMARMAHGSHMKSRSPELASRFTNAALSLPNWSAFALPANLAAAIATFFPKLHYSSHPELSSLASMSTVSGMSMSSAAAPASTIDPTSTAPSSSNAITPTHLDPTTVQAYKRLVLLTLLTPPLIEKPVKTTVANATSIDPMAMDVPQSTVPPPVSFAPPSSITVAANYLAAFKSDGGGSDT